ncbi:glycoside hydrolase family 16 protein [Mycobacterium sp. WMMD1722]|uniref:glycoside hydrolase family 16 protein n=1 Tax=Mycobacterium sp. WMMD1722 TaxID=3404117 RepID=UPI003BF5DF8E
MLRNSLFVVSVPAILAGCLTGAAEGAPSSNGNCAATAADTQGWGVPDREAGFDAPSALNDWWLYDGPGHDGNGRRTPAAISVADGELTIAGDAVGNSGGMAWRGGGQMYGRWEVCARSTVAAETYHSVALLWPDANDWPIGGEVDFMEIVTADRQRVDYNLHYGSDDRREGHQTFVDATQWHSWAVEWTPERIAVFVDGQQWAQSTDPSRFPPRSMHLCLQLDDFGGDTGAGGQLAVDWARQYRLA